MVMMLTKVDFLQLMLNAESDHQEAEDEDSTSSDTATLSSGTWKRGTYTYL